MYLFVFPLKLRKWETRVLSIDQRIQWARVTIFQNFPQVYAYVTWLPGEMKATVQAAACARSNVPGRLEGFRCCPYPSGSTELSTKAAGGRGQSWWWYKGQGSSGLERLWFFLLRTYPQRLCSSSCHSPGTFVRTRIKKTMNVNHFINSMWRASCTRVTCGYLQITIPPACQLLRTRVSQLQAGQAATEFSSKFIRKILFRKISEIPLV